MQLERVAGVDLRSARSLDDEDEVFAGRFGGGVNESNSVSAAGADPVGRSFPRVVGSRPQWSQEALSRGLTRRLDSVVFVKAYFRRISLYLCSSSGAFSVNMLLDPDS
jgi:hypothetical protein